MSGEIYTASLAFLCFPKDWKKPQIIKVPKTGKALKRGDSSKPIIPGRILVFYAMSSSVYVSFFYLRKYIYCCYEDCYYNYYYYFDMGVSV